MASDPNLYGQAQQGVQIAVEWLRLVIEGIGMLVIATGIVVALVLLVKCLLSKRQTGFTSVRLALARHLALALEFQLAADILSTAIAPSWEQIGKLAAIAVIRTALNYFLMLEMRSERARLDPVLAPAGGRLDG